MGKAMAAGSAGGLHGRRGKAQNRGVSGKSHSSTNPDRAIPDGKKAGFYRSKSKIALLNLYSKKPDLEKMKKRPLEPARIHPDRRWFGNTRVITQTKLAEFREAMENAKQNPYAVVLKRTKLPVSLFNDSAGADRVKANLLEVEPFCEVFGKKRRQKRAKLKSEELGNFATDAQQAQGDYGESGDASLVADSAPDFTVAPPEEVMKKGTSRRIWQEMFKVVDSSDIIVEVVDARDPEGTRCRHLERLIKKDRPGKYIILLLNKADLVPNWACSRWVSAFSSEFPTVAFHASVKKSFGKMTLINLLRQYAALLKERKHVSVGFIGYPNVGKSSVINTLRAKAVCKAAPVPGETKVWQYISLTARVHLIDCPGIVPGDVEAGDDCDKVLKGAVRAERIAEPDQYIPEVLRRVKKVDLVKRYKSMATASWSDADEFLAVLARRMGRLLKGAEPDVQTTARIVLRDWQRGRLPFFVPPPGCSVDEEAGAEAAAGEKAAAAAPGSAAAGGNAGLAGSGAKSAATVPVFGPVVEPGKSGEEG